MILSWQSIDAEPQLRHYVRTDRENGKATFAAPPTRLRISADGRDALGTYSGEAVVLAHAGTNDIRLELTRNPTGGDAPGGQR